MAADGEVDDRRRHVVTAGDHVVQHADQPGCHVLGWLGPQRDLAGGTDLLRPTQWAGVGDVPGRDVGELTVAASADQGDRGRSATDRHEAGRCQRLG